MPPRFGRKFNILRQPVGGREFRNLDQDAEGMAGMDENLLPDAAGILVVAEKGNALLLQMGHRLAEVRRLKGDVVDPSLPVFQKTVQKASLARGRDDLQTGQISQGKELPEKPGLGIVHPCARNGPQDVAKKMLGLCLVPDRDGYMVDARYQIFSSKKH